MIISGCRVEYMENAMQAMMETFQDWPVIAKRSKKNPGIKYVNLPMSFDIETYNFERDGELFAPMYVWQFAIDGKLCIIGRTWDEWHHFCTMLSHHFRLSTKMRIMCHVHNLSFEMGYLLHQHQWSDVFATDKHKPLYMVNEYYMEFRCSFMLSGMSLKKLGEDMQGIQKLDDFDYNLAMNSKTPLTEEQLAYCVHDVLVVCEFIKEEIARNKGSIAKIPLTKTGYVRNYTRDNCLYKNEDGSNNHNKYFQYRRIMDKMQLDPDTYMQAKRCYQGGFTHASCFYAGDVMEDVDSYDISSSYPASLFIYQFPMGKGERLTLTSWKQFEEYLSKHCCMFDVELTDLQPKIHNEHILSVHKCWNIEWYTDEIGQPQVEKDNGRIVRAKRISTTMNEIDWIVFNHYYSYESARVYNFIRFPKRYLPTDFIKSMIKLYKDKTVYKGVKEKEEEYKLSKSQINSLYGCLVTDVCRSEISLDEYNMWTETEADVQKEIEEYNNSTSRFSFFLWGIWTTSYSRARLHRAIECFSFADNGNGDFQPDYLYSDTDSIKCINGKEHEKWIEEENERINELCRKACEHHKIPYEDTRPQDRKGIEHPLGIWEYDGHYKRAKFLRAKSYLTQYDDNSYHLTCAGVGKNAVKYIEKVAAETGKDVFSVFDDNMVIPSEYTGKLTHTYIEYPQSGVVTDYLGNTAEFHELSSVNLSPCEFSMNLIDSYVKFLIGVKEERYCGEI